MNEDEKKPPSVSEQIARSEPEPQAASDPTASPSLEDEIADFESLLADLAATRDEATVVEHLDPAAYRAALKKGEPS